MQACKAENQKKISPTFLVFLLGALIAIGPMSIDMYLPAFGEIAESFGVSIHLIELSITAYFFGMAFGQIFYGPLTDRFGRKAPLLAGLGIYMVATVGCLLSQDVNSFIAFRALQAIGGGCGMVVTRAIARDLFNKQEVADFFSNMTLVIVLAPIFAPIIGTFINEMFGWRAIFVVLLLFGLFCAISLIYFLPETNNNKHKTIHIWTILKNYWGLLKDITFTRFLIPHMAVRGGLFAYITASSFVFINLFGLSAESFSLIFAINGAGIMASSQINRFFLKFFEPEQIVPWGLVAFAVFGVALFISGYFLNSMYLFAGSLFLFISCLPIVGANAMACAFEHQGEQAGTASSLYGFAQWAMASFASLIVSLLHDTTIFPMAIVLLIFGLLAPLSYLALKFFSK